MRSEGNVWPSCPVKVKRSIVSKHMSKIVLFLLAVYCNIGLFALLAQRGSAVVVANQPEKFQ